MIFGIFKTKEENKGIMELTIRKPKVLNENEYKELIEEPLKNNKFTPILNYENIGIDLNIDDEVLLGLDAYIVDAVVYGSDNNNHVISVSVKKGKSKTTKAELV